MNKIITREILMYGIFGLLTTAVNVATYSLFYYAFDMENVASTVIAWLFAVIFAYFTNRKWVFESNKNIAREGVEFFAFRLLSEIFDVIIMYLGVDVLKFAGIFVKIVANVIVIILNYLFSKLYIFKKKEY